jgi:hypothetical protein
MRIGISALREVGVSSNLSGEVVLGFTVLGRLVVIAYFLVTCTYSR